MHCSLMGTHADEYTAGPRWIVDQYVQEYIDHYFDQYITAPLLDSEGSISRRRIILWRVCEL